MSESTREKSGTRLPLALTLGFFVLVAGVVIWLSLEEAPPPPPPEKPPEAAAPAPVKAPAPQKLAQDKPAPVTPAPDPPGEVKGTKTPDVGHADEEKGARKEAAPAPAPEEETKPETTAAAKTPAVAETKAAKTAKAEPSAKPDPAPAKTKEPQKPQTASVPAPEKKSPPRGLQKRAVMPKPLARILPDEPLSPAPDPALVQVTALGPLPRIGPDGRLPYKVYAKPFNQADTRPRIGIVVTGLGLSDAATESAIQGLPGGVTLAFAPYSPRLNEWIRLARAAGHEVLINIPMEPVNYPAYDPGPQTLLTSMNAEGNLDRLFWSLSRGTGYVGVIDFYGSRFTTSRKHMQPVLAALKARGLLYLDSGSSARTVSAMVSGELGLPAAQTTLTLDGHASRKNIDRKFGELEKIARREKTAIGIASPYPVTLERIAAWSRQLRARGLVIAPISAIATGSVPAPAPKQKP